jgi:hypothetical protein
MAMPPNLITSVFVKMVITTLFTSDALAARVTGTLDQWSLWSFDTNTIQAACIAGESPCDETQVPPSPFAGSSIPINIPVEGKVSFAAGEVRELTLIQSRQVVLPIAGGSHGELTLSGIRWTLSNGMLLQAPGAFAECSTMAPVCRVLAAAIQDPAIDSPLDFDGIPKNFPIQFGALLLNLRPPFRADMDDDGDLFIETASSQPQSSPTSTIFNSAAVFRFSLTVSQGKP